MSAKLKKAKANPELAKQKMVKMFGESGGTVMANTFINFTQNSIANIMDETSMYTVTKNLYKSIVLFPIHRIRFQRLSPSTFVVMILQGLKFGCNASY